MKHCVFLFLIILILDFPALQALDRNIEMSTAMKINIMKSSHKTSYWVKTETTDSYTFLKSQALQNPKFYFVEYPTGKLTKTKYRYNNIPVTPSQGGWFFNNINDILQSDTKIHWVTISQCSKVGDRVEIFYKNTYEDIKEFPFIPIRHDMNNKKISLVINYPENLDIKLQFITNHDKFKPIINEYIDQITVEIDSLEIPEDKPYLNDKNICGYIVMEVLQKGVSFNSPQINPYIKYYMEKLPETKLEFKYFIESCRLAVDSLKYNKDFPNSFSKLEPEKKNYLENLVKTMSKSTLNKIEDLFKQLDTETSDYEKVSLLYKFTQANLRYIAKEDSIHNIIPHHPAQILNWMYGDCKDLSFLMSNIAALYDIQINLALTNLNHESRPEFVSISMFNHMFAIWNYHNTNYYLDATDDYTNLADIPGGLANRPYLLLTQETKTYDTVRAFSLKPLLSTKITAKMDSLAGAMAEITLRGLSRSMLLQVNNTRNTVDRDNICSNFLSAHYSGISFKDFQYSEITDSTLIIQAMADLSKFVIISKSSTYFKKTPFLLNNDVIERKKDDYSIYLEDVEFGELSILFPEILLEVPEDILSFSAGDSRFTASIGRDQESAMLLNYRIMLRSGNYADKRKQELIQFLENYKTHKSDMFIYRR